MELKVHRAINEKLTEVRERCIADHYLHRWPDARSLPFGYYLEIDGQCNAPDGRLLGVVVMKKPQHHQHRHLFGYPNLPTAWQVLDLARVWVHPSLQRKENGHSLCIFSQMVSRVLRRVQADWLIHHPPRYPDQPYHIEVIISYCDLNHHDGKAYRASGFQWNGYSGDKTKEIYFRKLRPPMKSWKPGHRPVQIPLPLFDMPLVHG
jgi:hypothetical protein